MECYQARLEFEEDGVLWIAELLSQLNRAERRAWRWTNNQGNALPAKEMTSAKLLVSAVIPDGFFTSHQEGMIARKVAADMKTAKGMASHVLESKREALSARLSPA